MTKRIILFVWMVMCMKKIPLPLVGVFTVKNTNRGEEIN
jgi:hypothetical protein